MTSLKPVPDPPAGTLDSRLCDVIAMVDNALRVKAGRPDPERLAAIDAEQNEAAAARARARQAGWKAATEKQPMLTVAVHLTRATAIGDHAGIDALLSRPRTVPEWRALAEILAAAADPARITVPGQAEPHRRQGAA